MNLARLKKGAEHFEIVVHPDQALAWRKTQQGDIRDTLFMQGVFTDAKKGLHAPEHRLKAVFGTDDVLEVAKQIILKGEIQLTAEFHQQRREQKRKQIVELIHRFGIDPRTKAPHPITRIEAALEEAKAKIDEFKSVEEQAQEIIKLIQPIIPIAFATKKISITIPAQHASKSYAVIKKFGKILREAWLSDGSWQGTIEVPGGLENDLYDQINKLTRGEATITRE